MFRPVFILVVFVTLSVCELLYVSELFRHGARYTVLDLYDHNQSSIDDGELTGVGMRQHYNLGRYIRQEYINSLSFLNQSFDHREISIYSTQRNRTIQSALSHLYGLYPDQYGPKLSQNIKQSLLLPAFQDSTSSLNSEYALPKGGSSFPMHSADPFFDCPQQTLLVLETMKSRASYISLIDLEYTPLFLRMAPIFKLKPSYEANVGVMALLYDNIIADYYLGKPFPPGFDWQDLMNLRHLSQIMMSVAYEGNAGKAKSSLLFTKIISDFDNKLSHPSHLQKWTLLSGHDTNVLPTLIFLNITGSSCLQDKWKGHNLDKYVNCEDGPDFAASLLFQLHEDNGQKKMRIKYNGKYMNLCGRKETSCLYSEWKSRIQNQYVDYKNLCHYSRSSNPNPTPNLTTNLNPSLYTQQ